MKSRGPLVRLCECSKGSRKLCSTRCAEETVQGGRRHEDQSSSPRTQVKEWCTAWVDRHSPEEAEAGGNRWASGSPARQLVSSRLVRDPASSAKAEKLENTRSWPLAFPNVCTSAHAHTGMTGVMVTHFQYHSRFTRWHVLLSLWTILFLGLLTLWQGSL